MAIVKPEEMSFSGERFGVIISGSPGSGKTTMALSAPNPLLIDFDKGVSRVNAKHRRDTIIATTYEEILNDLKTDLSAYESIICDTGGSFITCLQDYVMRDNPNQNCKKNGTISIQGFGAVKAEFERFTSWVRLTLNKHLIFVFHTVEEKDKDGNVKQRLMCEGSARNTVWTPVTLGCFLQMIGDDRVAGFSPTEEYFAKSCHGISGLIKLPKLEGDTQNTFLTDIFIKMQKSLEEENAVFADNKAIYDKAMEQGKKIAEEVKDVATANKAIPKLKKIEHGLTSQKEVGVIFNAKIKELGLIFSKETGRYEIPSENANE